MCWGAVIGAIGAIIASIIASNNSGGGGGSPSQEDVQTKQVSRMTPDQEELFNSLIKQARNRNFYQTPGLANTPRPANSISGAFNALGTGPVGGSNRQGMY